MASPVVQERRRLRQEAAERQRTVLRDLKTAVRKARSNKRRHLTKIQRKCVRDQLRIQRDAVKARAQLRERIKKAKEKARAACKACKVSATDKDLKAIDKALADVAAEREAIAELRARAARLKDPRGRAGGLRAQELRRESDDVVRGNLNDEWQLAVWEKVKHLIRETPYATRTEMFLQYLHDHPESIWEAQQAAEARWLKEAEEEQTRLEAEWLNKRQLAKLSDPELEELSRGLARAERFTGTDPVPF